MDLLSEEIHSIGGKVAEVAGIPVFGSGNRVLFVARTMSEKVACIHTWDPKLRIYASYRDPDRSYLPTMYGTKQDFHDLYDTGECILVEGVFDRIAMKHCIPGMAVFARLTKGIGPTHEIFLRRYAKQVWLAFDQDIPGKFATTQAFKRLGGIKGLDVYEIPYPAKDPAALLEKKGCVRAAEILQTNMRKVGPYR